MKELIEKTLSSIACMNHQEQVDFFMEIKAGLLRIRKQEAEKLACEIKEMDATITSHNAGSEIIAVGPQVVAKQGY